MHIAISSATGAVDGRTRAYVEYRVFDTLRSLEREIRTVDVLLFEQSERPRVVTCAMVIALVTGERVTASATADWPYAAVDRAIGEASKELSNRTCLAI